MDDYDDIAQRPTSGTAFGIIALVLAGFAILSTLFALLMNIIKADQRAIVEEIFASSTPAMIWYWLSTVVWIGLSAWLAGIGYGLLTDKAWARKQAVLYASVQIVWLIISTPLTHVWITKPSMEIASRQLPSEMQAYVEVASIGATACGAIIGLIFPVLLIYFMSQPHVKAWYDHR